VRRLLAWPPLLWAGLISYSLYLWHPALVSKLVLSDFDEQHGAILATLVMLAGSFALAAVSFYLVERPALRLGRRLASGGRRETPGDPGAQGGLGSPADDEVTART
jgi:peptidoglycan/LPS O-acetylase OafA/YrhL